MKTKNSGTFIKLFGILSIIYLSYACSGHMKPMKTVENVDLDRYLGTWYEIARLPNRFEKGLVCVTAEYSLREDGKIRVVNRGHKEKDRTKVKEATGKAWRPDKKEPGRLKVQFFWPFSGGYYIFHLDTLNYQYALVGEPGRDYFWLLSRTPEIDESLYKELMGFAEANGYDTAKFYKTPQDCQ
ncbi:MAG: lipocalin family protein [bacterium]